MDSDKTLHDRWQWISELLADALQIADRGARVAFVRERCGEDHEAAREILSLLDADTVFARTLDEPVMGSAVREMLNVDNASTDELSASRDWIGQRLGAYEIVDVIAVGGMGAVYKGKRADQTYETLVAIKIMRSDLGAKAAQNVLARFRAERQMLASLNHPNITRLIDGGSTEGGLPYFVMEYVDGEPIDRYCETKALTTRDRLEKFRDVCSAVHFAHQRLIVHRDLKPSNILVDKTGTVKLLDFGIARLYDPDDANKSGDNAPMTTMLALTPAYASPEQVKNEAITTASDVYSLGVVLYRMLTGRSPYKATPRQSLDLAREIVETNPERPSTAITKPDDAVASVATEPGDGVVVSKKLDLARLRKALRGDLDNIILKALRKDPTQRYASVEQFSEDIARHLDGEPVIAHADSLAYRAKKFVQRNQWSAAFASLAAIGLIGGIIATTYQAKLARDAQARAETELARAERLFGSVRDLSNRFVGDVFEQIQTVPGTEAAQQTVIATATEYLDKLANEATDNRKLLLEAAQGHLKLSQLQQGALLDVTKRTATLNRGLTLVGRAERLGERDSGSLAILLHLESRLGEIETIYAKRAEARARFERLLPFALDPNSETYGLQRAKGDYLLTFGTSATSLGLPLTSALDHIAAAERHYRAAIDKATDSNDRFTSRMLAALAKIETGKAQAELPNGAGLRNAIPPVEFGYEELEILLRERPTDQVLLTNTSFAATLLADYAAKLGEYARARDYFRLAFRHEDKRSSDSLRQGDANTIALRLTHLEVEILANTAPDDLATMIAVVDQLIAKFPKESIEARVLELLNTWRECVAGEVLLRQGSDSKRPTDARVRLLDRSVETFARCDELLKRVPKEYIDQNRPEIIELVTTGSARSRLARGALRR